jgi:hypothetical protein
VVSLLIAALVNPRLSVGFYSVRLNPKTLASGTYLCKMSAGIVKRLNRLSARSRASTGFLFNFRPKKKLQ